MAELVYRTWPEPKRGLIAHRPFESDTRFNFYEDNMRLHYEWPCPFCDFVGQNRRLLAKHKAELHKRNAQTNIVSARWQLQVLQ